MWLKRLLLFASQSSLIVEAASKMRTEAVNKIENSPVIKRYRYLIYGNIIISLIAIVMSTVAIFK